MEDAIRLDRDFFYQPLFQRELELAQDKAGTEPLCLDPDRHFSKEEQGRLGEIVRTLVTLMPAGYEAWEAYYNRERERYNRGLPRCSDGGGAIQGLIKELVQFLN